MRTCIALVALAACSVRAHADSPAPIDAAPPLSRVPSPSVVPDPGPAPPPTPSLAPLPGFFEPLAIAGHPDAWLSLPTGSTSRRPVVVVIHGAGDRPDWQCGGWRRTIDAYAFVVCPTGARNAQWSTPGDTRYTHTGGAALLAHVDAAIAALAARYGERVDTGAPLLAGFSLGASEILALAAADPARFPRIALVEGATDAWTDARVAAFRKGGGARVLYGCGQRGCDTAVRATVKRLVTRGVEARAVYAPVAHTFDPPLQDAMRGELRWWLDGDARWVVAP